MSPASSASTWSRDTISVSVSSTDGRCWAIVRIHVPSTVSAEIAVNPIRSVPAVPRAALRAVIGAAAARLSMRLASGRNASPAGVSRTARGVLTSSSTSSARSSFCTWRDSGGCVMRRRAAARPKLPSSATATNPRSCSSVNDMLERYRKMRSWT
jgi:hypothetical protein